MRPLARQFALVLPLAAALAFVVPAIAHPNKPAVAPQRNRFSFHVTANPSSGSVGGHRMTGGIQETAVGSGSFTLGRRLEQRGGTQTWKVTNPQGSVLISSPNAVSPSGVTVLLQADVVSGGTYTTRKVNGRLEQTAKLTLYPWSTSFTCNVSASTRFTLLLTDLPQRKAKDTIAVTACPGNNVAWKGTPPTLTVRIVPA
jgi:hypothetical protein